MIRPGLLLVLALTLPAPAVTLSQFEDFSSGTTNWTSGTPNPNPPVIVADSGPLGPGDSAFRISSNGGTGAGGKLITYDRTIWTGSYLDAGIDAISIDLRNIGPSNLTIRMAINGAGGWFVTDSVSLLRFGGWTTQLFDLSPDALLAVVGSTDVNLTMDAVTEVRILHEPAIDFRGPNLTAQLLVDNIQAVPETGVAGWGLIAVGVWLRRKRG